MAFEAGLFALSWSGRVTELLKPGHADRLGPNSRATAGRRSGIRAGCCSEGLLNSALILEGGREVGSCRNENLINWRLLL